MDSLWGYPCLLSMDSLTLTSSTEFTLKSICGLVILKQMQALLLFCSVRERTCVVPCRAYPSLLTYSLSLPLFPSGNLLLEALNPSFAFEHCITFPACTSGSVSASAGTIIYSIIHIRRVGRATPTRWAGRQLHACSMNYLLGTQSIHKQSKQGQEKGQIQGR